ncbi:MAG: tetratricopeptide repeat protein [Ilumatobacteraceae bacterium]
MRDTDRAEVNPVEERPRTAAQQRAAAVRARGGGRVGLDREAREAEDKAIEQWIDEGPVRSEAVAAVERAEPRRQRSAELDPEVAERIGAVVPSAQRAARLRERLTAGYEALGRDRFGDARRIGNSVLKELTEVAAAHELVGFANYRLGAWRQAAVALERAQSLRPDPGTMPVLMDCLRAMGRHREVEAVWRELKEASPGHEVMAEGRIVMAGSYADRGDLRSAIDLMESAATRPKRVRDHHLRQWYVLADLYDRAGDVIGARRWFETIAANDVEFVDVRARLRALGR